MKPLGFLSAASLSLITASVVAAVPPAAFVADHTADTSSIVDKAQKPSPADHTSGAGRIRTKEPSMTPSRHAPHLPPTVSDSMQKKVLPEKASGAPVSKSGTLSDSPLLDTTILPNGSYLSVGFGWSLGGFTLLSLWENALPDSLGSFGLGATSFSIPYDSTGEMQNSRPDTARLFFSVKEKPDQYTMSFPVSLSLVRIREHDRFAFSLYGSWMSKSFTAAVAAAGDSLSRKADYRERMNIFSPFLSVAYGLKIPEEYFSIHDVQRCFFNAALEVSPLIACFIRRSVTSPHSDIRFGSIRETMAHPSRRFMHGSSAALRLGLIMTKRMNAFNATDIGIAYCLQGYGYFFENGSRVTFAAADPSNSKKGRPLYWVSHRFEISIALLRRYRN